ncbi:MAG: hypothetical protein V9G12_16895 [Microthrixaceae bacterium]
MHRHADAVGLAPHRHLDAGGVAGVAHGVGDRLLGEAEDGGIDGRPQPVEVSGELDVDPGPFAGAGGEVLDLGDAALRGEVRFLSLSQGADHRAHLGEGPGGLLLDDDQGFHRGARIGGGDDTAGLGPDGDGRDVVGDGVMELAGQLLPLEELHLVHPPATGLVRVPDRGADRRHQEHEHGTLSHLAERDLASVPSWRLGVEGDEQHRDRQDQGSPITASRPEPQRKSAYTNNITKTVASRPRHSSPRTSEATSTTVTRPKAAATHWSGCVRRHSNVGSSGQRDHHGEHAPDQVLAERSLEHHHGHQRRDERPVPPDPAGRIGNAGLGPQRTSCVPEHHPTLRNVRQRADRPKGRDGNRPIGGCRMAGVPMWRGAGRDITTMGSCPRQQQPPVATGHSSAGSPAGASITGPRPSGSGSSRSSPIFGAGGAVGSQFSANAQVPGSGSAAGFAVLDEHFPELGTGGQTGTIVFRAAQGVDDPEVRAAMEELFATVDAGFPDDAR